MTEKKMKIEEAATDRPADAAVKSRYIRTISLNAKKYGVLRDINVASGEADLHVVEDENDRRLMLKHYRAGIEPKGEIVKVLKALDSPHVIKIIDTGVTSEDGRFFELMEFMEHGSLADYIRKNKPLAQPFIKEFVRELDRALCEIHSKNIIHRDIKPANILISSIEPLKIVLIDFGISSISEKSIHQTGQDRTIAYAAPETMTGIVSKSTDYWALGIITLEMLLGYHPFEKKTAQMIMYAITTRAVPGIEKINDDFTPLVRGTLTRDDTKRWQGLEISMWLKGRRDIPVFFDEKSLEQASGSEPATGSPSQKRHFIFDSVKYNDVRELARALSQNWAAASKRCDLNQVKQWVMTVTEDEGMTFLIKELNKSKSMSFDEELFELLYTMDPELEFIYAGQRITPDYLNSVSKKIIKRTASEVERNFLTDLIEKKIIKKYYELTCHLKFYDDNYKAICDNCLKRNNVDEYAAEFIRFSGAVDAAVSDQARIAQPGDKAKEADVQARNVPSRASDGSSAGEMVEEEKIYYFWGVVVAIIMGMAAFWLLD